MKKTMIIICCFIPYFGVIIAWFNVFYLIKQPWFMFYHLIGCAVLVGFIIKWLELI